MKKLFFYTFIFSLCCGSLSALTITITNDTLNELRARTAYKDGGLISRGGTLTIEKVEKGDQAFATKNINSNNFDIACPKVTKDQAFRITREEKCVIK